MKLTVQIGRDEELRQEVLKLVKREIKQISDGEIHKMARDYLNDVNISAKVTNTIKDVVNKQIDFLVRGYGDVTIRQKMNGKMNHWVENNFEKWFSGNAKEYIRNYLDGKVQSFKEFTQLLDKTKNP